MLASYIPLAILIILSVVFAILIVIVGSLFGPRRTTPRKEMPYESGMTPIGPGTRRIPVRFYLVAVLFILFDIEIIFIIPWAVILKEFVAANIGIFYAWKKGALEWE
jgi:NADH-quinone oxidoreductase subunit A